MPQPTDVQLHVGHDVMYSELGWTNWETAIEADGKVAIDQVIEWNNAVQDATLICFDCDMELTGWSI